MTIGEKKVIFGFPNNFAMPSFADDSLANESLCIYFNESLVYMGDYNS